MPLSVHVYMYIGCIIHEETNNYTQTQYYSLSDIVTQSDSCSDYIYYINMYITAQHTIHHCHNVMQVV